MKCVFEHGPYASDNLGSANFLISLKVKTTNQDVYTRLVEAITKAMAPEEEVEEKRDALGFGTPDNEEENS